MTTNFWYLFFSTIIPITNYSKNAINHRGPSGGRSLRFPTTIIHHSIFVAVCNTASNCRAGAWLLPKETNRKRWDIKPHPTRGAIHPYKKYTTPSSSWAKSKDLTAKHYFVMQWYKFLAEFVIYLRCDISLRMWYITFGDVVIVGTLRRSVAKWQQGRCICANTTLNRKKCIIICIKNWICV